MNPASRIREPIYSLGVLAALTFLVLAAMSFGANLSSNRLLAALVGGALLIAGALLSGNVRLFCLWGLGVSVPFLLAKTFGEVIDKGGGEVALNLDVTDLFLGLLSLYVFHDLWTGRRDGLRIPIPAFVWMAIMGFGVVAIAAGPYRSVALFEVFRMAKMLVLFLVLCHELQTPKRLIHWCGALTSGLIVNAVFGLAEFYYERTFGLADLGEANEDVIKTLAATSLQGSDIWRVGAFLLHPNVFGAFLAVVLPLTMACFLIAGGKVQKIYYLGAFVLGSTALVATYSRSGWLSFAVAFTLFMLFAIGHSGLRRRSATAAVALGILLIGVLIAARGEIAGRIMNSKAEAVSFRQVFNEDAKRMIEEKPMWGFGLNSYVLNLPAFARYQYGSWPPPVHNTYYLWWAETGLIGLSLHLLMWGGIVWAGMRNFRVKDARMYAINAACVVGMIAFALDGLVSFSLRITPTLKTFWVIAAMIMAVHYWRLRHERAERPTGAGTR